MLQATEAKTLNEGICVRCRRILPSASFRRNAMGGSTAWCDPCRRDAAAKWKVEEDLVEMVYALHLYEQSLKREAQVVSIAMVHQGKESPRMLEHLETQMRVHDQLRFSRIPDRLTRFLREYRTAFYAAINMAPPEGAPAPDVAD